MQKPKRIRLNCEYCEQSREMLLQEIIEKGREVIYRGSETKTRYVPCPNCGKDVKVEIPAEWLDE